MGMVMHAGYLAFETCGRGATAWSYGGLAGLCERLRGPAAGAWLYDCWNW